MKKSLLCLVAVATLFTASSATFTRGINNPAVVKADNVSTHALSTPYVVYGAGVAQSVYPSLNNIFQTNSNFKELTATANDYRKYINPSNTGATNASMISSVALAPADPGSGIQVNIKPYNGQNNILQVTSQQYAMVAQMAGVTDLNIIVTANEPVSGTSALTGVYEALAADGAQINPKNTAAANQMIQATQPAIQQNKQDQSYPGKLMAAVGNASKQVAKQKQQNNQSLTPSEIQQIVRDALNDQGILNKTPNQVIVNITDSLKSFQSAPISSSKSYINNVTNTINNVKNSSGNLMNKAKSFLNSPGFKASEQQVKQEATSWFDRLIQWIKNLF